MTVRVDPPERDPAPARSPWEGMSGAAVFSGDVLIGVIGRHHRADGLGTLASYRVDSWYERLPGDRLFQLADLIGMPYTATGLTQVSGPDPARPDGAPRQLPADTGVFAGREHELADLVDLAGRGGRLGTPGVATIDGMAGIGKTALAVHVAHRLADRYPDGQIFLDLHGYTEGLAPRDPADALASVLQGFGVPPQRVPHDLDGRAALYRARLSGTRTLILLDNARSEAQIRPLIPGHPGCMVLITSRRRLKAMDDAETLSMELLPTEDTVALFHQVAGPTRFPADDPELPGLVALCGNLPLAVRIAAALIRHRPSWTLAHLAGRLRESRPDLSRFADGDRELSAVFDLSYYSLAADQRTLYRRTGLVPGPQLDAYAAAALMDRGHDEAGRLLETLVDHNLLAEPVPGRYQLHDLVRAHAQARVTRDDPAADRDDALDRLLDYYQYAAQRAGRHLARYTPSYLPAVAHEPIQVPTLDSRERADAWILDELPNLTAAVHQSSVRARPTHAVALAASLHDHLRIRGPWTQALDLHSTAADTAASLGDRQGQANALDNLGADRWRASEFPGSAEAYTQALELYRALGDRRGQAAALTGLGIVLRQIGDYVAAAESSQRALAEYRELADRAGQVYALNALAQVLTATGDLEQARTRHTEALLLARTLSSPWDEAESLEGLGEIALSEGHDAEGRESLTAALEIHRRLGTPDARRIKSRLTA